MAPEPFGETHMTDPKPHIGDLVAEMLAKSGVEYVFGMPGGQTTACMTEFPDAKTGLNTS